MSQHEVWCEFLRTEYNQRLPTSLWPECKKLTTSPNFEDKGQNNRRLKLLRSIRCPIVDAIPADTTWAELALSPEEFAKLHVIRSGDWITLSNGTGELATVATNLEHSTQKSSIRSKVDAIIHTDMALSDFKTITISKTVASIATIVDGCHRATALYIRHFLRKNLSLAEVASFIGISPLMDDCKWLF